MLQLLKWRSSIRFIGLGNKARDEMSLYFQRRNDIRLQRRTLSGFSNTSAIRVSHSVVLNQIYIYVHKKHDSISAHSECFCQIVVTCPPSCILVLYSSSSAC